MDSISREGLLALLRATTMSQVEIIKLVEMMAPVENDSNQPSRYMDLSVQPDLLNWPVSILAGMG